MPVSDVKAERARLNHLVEEHYRSIINGVSDDLIAEMEEGFAAAQDLISLTGDQLHDPSAAGLSIINELASRSRNRADPRVFAAWKTHGTAAQRLGVLLVVGALVNAGMQGVAPTAQPIVVIEDPESHLHPMTLASAWDLLARIRWQKLITTHSEALLGAAPLSSIRRVEWAHGDLRDRRVREGDLSPEELRKFSYHIRFRRGNAMFSRCWLFVEGETEFWMMPELARLCGYDFRIEGIACVEFAQAGLSPLIKVARSLHIEWHVMADGDAAGHTYGALARRFVDDADEEERITLLRARDIERVLWRHGYAEVYRRHARISRSTAQRLSPARVIDKAIAKTSKPYMAIEVLQAVSAPDSPGVPDALRAVIERCVQLARDGPVPQGE